MSQTNTSELNVQFSLYRELNIEFLYIVSWTLNFRELNIEFLYIVSWTLNFLHIVS